MIYSNQKELLIELRKVMLDAGIMQKDIAERLNVKPTSITKRLHKQNITFEDMKMILDGMDYEMEIKFKPKSNE